LKKTGTPSKKKLLKKRGEWGPTLEDGARLISGEVIGKVGGLEKKKENQKKHIGKEGGKEWKSNF